MHTPEIVNYNTGYEWWLMTEAKKRNPDIKLVCRVARETLINPHYYFFLT